MEYVKHDMGNYNLYLIKTKKFKTITVSANFRREKTKEDEVYCDLLKKIIGAATAKYHSLKELNRAFADIYDPRTNLIVTSAGLDRSITFEGMFVNEKYTEEGMNKKSIEFIFDIFLNPYIENGAFNEALFDVCKHDYIESLKSLKDNPVGYTRNRVWEEMNVYPYDEFKIADCIEFATKVTAKDLASYYASIFEKDSLDIFVAGDFDGDEIKEIIKKRIKGNFKKGEKNHFISYSDNRGDVKEVIETAENGQSNLALGLYYEDLTDFERKYVSNVYNTILGGNWSSVLMQVVREQNSLCYTIYAQRNIACGIFFIFAGIDAKDYEKTTSLIKEQLDVLAHGDFEDDSILQAKQIYKNALIDIEDNQSSILNTIISEVLSDNDSIEERRSNIEKVTKEDVVNLAKKVKLEVVYLLKGEKTDGKESI